MLRVSLLLLAMAAPAQATQEYILPTLFDVTGVSYGDSLNIREAPNAKARIVGRFARDATRIEVVEERAGWARVNTGEGSGWSSMRYLAYRTDVWPEGALPAAYQCFGTEPFWNLRHEAGQMVLSGPDMSDESHAVQSVLVTGVFRDPMRAVVAEGLTLVATPQLCSDGMSDRLFGLRASVVLHGATPRLLDGCCSIQP